MKILALDTSTEYCSAALWLNGEVRAERVHAGQSHSSLLLPMVDTLLAQSGMGLRALDGIAFGAGPGSFTGLRIACAVTQGLALGADLPVRGVSTLESIAQQTDAARVLTVLDARMNEVYWAAYERALEGWHCVIEPVLAAPVTVVLPNSASWSGAGNGLSLLDAANVKLPLAPHYPQLMPDASAMAALAAPAFARGEGMDATLAAPLYLRDKVAFTVAERQHKTFSETLAQSA